MILWSSDSNDNNNKNSMPEENHNQNLNPPALSREACLSPKGIRSFLQLSRLSTDDIIKAHLNNILDHRDRSLHKSNGEVCNDFLYRYLFNNWNSRLRSIEYCEVESKNLKSEIDKETAINEQKEAVTDPRINPYAEIDRKDETELKYLKYNQLNNWVNNEKEIEAIVQGRSIEIIKDTCKINSDLQQDFETWRSLNKT
ncbi:hypothetical protein PACTADRAFT_48223 [Pachysolen tannophilus NRRL Y-2460]|uniref:Uncharacterized protein n=1 Tax=Pachysolen tannophilus NRRL Y-2460 TaxID=669874 RepID=A0A1E4U378_PACTA|nr:hypothetical protein PACTADRAFT_48223 [Pachysolen tannophilus NRRL Y-2460]